MRTRISIWANVTERIAYIIPDCDVPPEFDVVIVWASIPAVGVNTFIVVLEERNFL
jgi:hypothetical protein